MNNTAKAASIAMALVFIGCVLIAVPFEAYAEPGAWDGTTVDTSWYEPGQTEYTIDSAADLAGLAQIVNETGSGTRSTFGNATIKITADINLGGNEWTPIGNGTTSSNYFYGDLIGSKEDGSNVVITGLKVTSTGEAKAGLTGTMEGNIENITIQNPSITAKSGQAGAFAGYRVNATSSQFTNLKVIGGSISSDSSAGGIAGGSYNSGPISNCSVDGTTIKSEDGDAGGIVGRHSALENGTGTISDCVVSDCTLSSGSAWDGTASVGGIVGQTITLTENETTIDSAEITNCTVESTKLTGHEDIAVGGIIGRAAAGASVSDCSFIADPDSETDLSGRYLGGIIGYATSSFTVSGSNVVDATFNATYGANYASGLVGRVGTATGCTVSDSYVESMRVTADTASIRYTVCDGVTVENVTHIDADPDYDGWKDDGTYSAIITEYDTDGKVLYYYSSFEDYLAEHSGAEEAELFDGASFDNDMTVNLRLSLAGSATVPYDVTLTFGSNDYLPTSGTLTVEGVVIVPDALSSSGLRFSGSGSLQIAGITYDTSLNTSGISLGWYYNGTSPYSIGTVEELRGLATLVNDQHISFEGDTVNLTASLDLGNGDWEPIGYYINKYGYVNDAVFEGTFDGNGHTVSNLNVNRLDQTGVGLFGAIGSGKIKDLTLDNATVAGKHFVGGIVGWYGSSAAGSTNNSIENCHVTGVIDISGHYMVGGLVGRSAAGLSNCSVITEEGSKVVATFTDEADCEGDNVGGLAGYMEDPAGSGKISECDVSGLTISGTVKIGGMVGAIAGSGSITGCDVKDVSLSSTATEDYITDAKTKGTNGMGGLLGVSYATGNNEITITNSSVTSVDLAPVQDMDASYITGCARGETVLPDVTETKVASDCTGANEAKLPEGVTQVTVYTVTFIVNGVETEVVVEENTAVPDSELPVIPNGYEAEWTVGGMTWNPQTPVTSDIEVTVTMTLEEGAVVIPVEFVIGFFTDGETSTFDTGSESAVVITWSTDEPTVATVNNGVITFVGPGDATITASLEDGTVVGDIGVRVIKSPDLEGITFETVTNADLDDELIPELEESIPWDITDVKGAIIGIKSDHSTFTLPYDIFSPFEWTVTSENYSRYEFLSIHIMDDGNFELVEVTPSESGLTLTVDSFSPFIFVYREAAVDPGDQPFIPFPDDDDEYVPPVVPMQPSDSGEGDTTTIVACAAAAVVAALMAVFLIIERRRS